MIQIFPNQKSFEVEKIIEIEKMGSSGGSALYNLTEEMGFGLCVLPMMSTTYGLRALCTTRIPQHFGKGLCLPPIFLTI